MLVSIIIPCFNCEKYIDKCLKSILNQTYKNFEILLYNDGSSDGTLNILKKYEEKYNFIKLYDQKNMGVSKTRNKSIFDASGDYIMFIDNDDYIKNDYVETFVNNCFDNDIVIGGYLRINQENKILKKMTLKDCAWSKYMVMSPWAKLYKRSFLISNNIQFLDNNIGEDVYFNMLAYSLTKKIKTIDYTGYNWYYNDLSVSNSKQKQMNNIEVMTLIQNMYDELNKLDKLNDEYVEYFFVRYIVWYLLFSSRKSDFKIIKLRYNELFSFLKRNFPKFVKNKNISFFKPIGETILNRLIIKLFIILYRMNLGLFFLKIYSIGGSNRG